MNNDSSKQLNGELNAYTGLAIQALTKEGYSSSQIKHLISGSMIEYIMTTIAVDNDNGYDYYALKPMLVALKFIFDRELQLKQEDAYIPQIQADMQMLKQLSDYLEKRIEVITDK